jgi:putative transcriptional regulator
MKNNIRVERAIKNITQAELAEQVDVSRQTINSIESNKYVPSALLAMKIARVFNKPVETIFMLEESDDGIKKR